MQSTESEPLPSFVLQNAYLRVQRYDIILEYRWNDMLNNNKTQLVEFVIGVSSLLSLFDFKAFHDMLVEKSSL